MSSIITAPEAAEILDVDPRTIGRWAESGKLDPARRPGRGTGWLFFLDTVLQLKRDRKAKTSAPVSPPRESPVFKVGDRVRVAKKVEYADGKWQAWVPQMDASLGQEGIIQAVEVGWRVLVGGERIRPNTPDWGWWYHPSALELIPEGSEP